MWANSAPGIWPSRYCCSPRSGFIRSWRQSNTRHSARLRASCCVETRVVCMMRIMAVTRSEIASVEKLIRPHVRRTPVVDPDGDGRRVFKLELLQHSGSFKARGAFTNLLTRKVPAAGVVAASGGNHGAAMAYAAQKLGNPARIYVPSVSSPAKIDRIRSYGAELVVSGERYADALAASERWAAESGAMQVHAYDQAGALLGQGTVGMEFEAQAPE